jgi:transcriptional regulator with XRE-family HTH domain
MQEVFLGEYIKQRRLELGLTQEELCDGICEPMTISRVENGRQTPSRNRINAILQRLGLPDDRYFALLSKNEMEIAALQREIVSCNVHHETEQGLSKIQALEAITEPDDQITKQFILRSKVLLGKADGPYSFEEKLAMLLEAIHLTVPKFNLDEINQNLYSMDEVKIINQIAKVYSENGQNKKAIDIYSQLLKYIKKHFQDVLQSNGMLPMITHNYARELSLCKRYEEAVEVAEQGRNICIKYGHYQYLPGLLAIMAECYYLQGNVTASEEMYYHAYYLYQSLGDAPNAQTMKEEAKRYLNIDFKF